MSCIEVGDTSSSLMFFLHPLFSPLSQVTQNSTLPKTLGILQVSPSPKSSLELQVVMYSGKLILNDFHLSKFKNRQRKPNGHV